MGAPLQKPSLAAFLNWEAEQPQRHELVRGEVFRLGEDGLWNLLDMSDGPDLEFESVHARVALDLLFKGMDSGPGGEATGARA